MRERIVIAIGSVVALAAFILVFTYFFPKIDDLEARNRELDGVREHYELVFAQNFQSLKQLCDGLENVQKRLARYEKIELIQCQITETSTPLSE